METVGGFLMRSVAVLGVFWISVCSYVTMAGELDKNLGWPGQTLHGNPCYGKPVGFGPYDYTNKKNWTKDKLFIVEQYHFPPASEHLTGTGAVSKRKDVERSLNGDFDYTLRAFPNHHRALWSKVRLYLENRNGLSEDERASRERAQQPFGPPECYLERAIAFAPDDAVPLMIYGIYLHRMGRMEQAMEKYREAERSLPQSGELAYNMGLWHFSAGDFEAAEGYAEKARALGHPLKGLANLLRKEREQ